MIRYSAAVLASMLFVQGEAWSEEQVKAVSPIALGGRVRLRAPTAVQGRIKGTVMEMDEKSLLVSADDRTPVRVPRQAITQLEVSTGRHSKALKGMLIGAAIGGVVGVYCDLDCNAAAVHAAGAVSGAVGGLLVGALFHGDRWSSVPLESVRVSVAPARGRGLALSLSLGW